jgi:DNA (cytosine-5)-methyltransferase 1
MSILQGFPRDYEFTGSLANMYRHIGDAVPPLISYQLARLSEWMLTDSRPEPADLLLTGCQLSSGDLVRA